MEQGERSDGCEGARWGQSNGGWPLGLQPVSARLSIASTSMFLISTPSLTSFSSSDFDTESTGSFFPEKSTTLGSLIGIQSSSQLASMQSSSMDDEKATRKSASANSRTRAWWSKLGCGGGLRDDALDISPSLSHFLDKERRGTLSHRQITGHSLGEHHTHDEDDQGHEQEDDERFDSGEVMTHSNVPCDTEVVVASRPCGPSLRVILQHPSPTSYLPSDWNVFSDLSHHHHIRRETSPGHGRCHTFWPGLCGRLSTCVAN